MYRVLVEGCIGGSPCLLTRLGSSIPRRESRALASLRWPVECAEGKGVVDGYTRVATLNCRVGCHDRQCSVRNRLGALCLG